MKSSEINVNLAMQLRSSFAEMCNRCWSLVHPEKSSSCLPLTSLQTGKRNKWLTLSLKLKLSLRLDITSIHIKPEQIEYWLSVRWQKQMHSEKTSWRREENKQTQLQHTYDAESNRAVTGDRGQACDGDFLKRRFSRISLHSVLVPVQP